MEVNIKHQVFFCLVDKHSQKMLNHYGPSSQGTCQLNVFVKLQSTTVSVNVNALKNELAIYVPKNDKIFYKY